MFVLSRNTEYLFEGVLEFLKIKAGVNHLVLHMLQHNGSRDLRTHHSLIVDNHAVALMTGLMPDWPESIGGSKTAERAFIF